MDGKYGLRNRDIEVEREGSTKDDTEYHIDWADEENVPLTDEDKALAEKKNDLSRYIKAPAFDDFFKPPGERNKDDESNKEIGEKAINRNTFADRKKKKTKSDDDERPTRKSRSNSGGVTVRRRSR
jgi:hypothetical protein